MTTGAVEVGEDAEASPIVVVKVDVGLGVVGPTNQRSEAYHRESADAQECSRQSCDEGLTYLVGGRDAGR